jgi:hypothetical protein
LGGPWRYPPEPHPIPVHLAHGVDLVWGLEFKVYGVGFRQGLELIGPLRSVDLLNANGFRERKGPA